jgi:hypothetical protein
MGARTEDANQKKVRTLDWLVRANKAIRDGEKRPGRNRRHSRRKMCLQRERERERERIERPIEKIERSERE